MRGMAGFQSEYSGTYFIARSQVEPPKELLQLIFPKLDFWMQTTTTDIATKGFLSLLAHLRLVFLQDSVLLRADYPQHSLWNLEVFKHPQYTSFAIDVLAHLNDDDKDMDSQIRLAIPILRQQVLNLNSSITNLVTDSFNKQLEQSLKMEGKLDDFLEGKIAFAFTPIKAQKLLNAAAVRDAPCAIDPRLQSSATTASSSTSLSFASPSKRATPSRSYRHRSTSPSAPPSYLLNRNIHTLTDLWKEWHVGLGTSPSIASLNDKYGPVWRKDWKGSEREFYSKRLAIITYIHNKAAGGSVEATVASIQTEMAAAKVTLNSLGTQIRKGLRR